MGEAKREAPSWRQNVNVKMLSRERLAEMRTEAEACDKQNEAAYGALQAAYKAYEEAAREYGVFDTIKRNGCRYIKAPSRPWSTWLQMVERYEREYAGEENRREEEQKKAQFARENAERQRKNDLALAGLIVRYSALESSDWRDMLALLCSKNKYLDLGIAGEETRGDWSDGFYRVAEALRRFKIEDERDKEIVADLAGCMDSEDGRVFRDTTWSYEALYEMVGDDQLVTDARSCLAHTI